VFSILEEGFRPTTTSSEGPLFLCPTLPQLFPAQCYGSFPFPFQLVRFEGLLLPTDETFQKLPESRRFSKGQNRRKETNKKGGISAPEVVQEFNGLPLCNE
jgi:hypothetical protein